MKSESPRASLWQIRCNSGADSTVWMREDMFSVWETTPEVFYFRGFFNAFFQSMHGLGQWACVPLEEQRTKGD